MIVVLIGMMMVADLFDDMQFNTRSVLTALTQCAGQIQRWMLEHHHFWWGHPPLHSCLPSVHSAACSLAHGVNKVITPFVLTNTKLLVFANNQAGTLFVPPSFLCDWWATDSLIAFGRIMCCLVFVFFFHLFRFFVIICIFVLVAIDLFSFSCVSWAIESFMILQEKCFCRCLCTFVIDPFLCSTTYLCVTDEQLNHRWHSRRQCRFGWDLCNFEFDPIVLFRHLSPCMWWLIIWLVTFQEKIFFQMIPL